MLPLAANARGKAPFDIPLVLSVLAIALGGVLAIRAVTEGDPTSAIFVRKQLLGIVIGAAGLAVFALNDYKIVLPRFAMALSVINVGLLLVVFKLGHAAKGAQRWIPLGPVQFQPSEVAKLVVIIALGVFMARHRAEITRPRTLLGSLGVILAPFLLIFLQPDLGTGLVIVTIWLGMAFVSGMRLRQMALIALAGLLAFSLLWTTGRIKEYQKDRLTSFIDPASDPRDTGYHLRQSQIAIGAGQLSGQGYGHGLQASGHFIPEQHTDFIFTIVGEEGGFIGSIALLGLYLFALMRCVWIMAMATDYFGRLLVAGVVSMLGFHIIVNIGMTIGLMPVTGVPLPFFSYGLSALMIDFSAIGIVLSVARRTQDTIFQPG